MNQQRKHRRPFVSSKLSWIVALLAVTLFVCSPPPSEAQILILSEDEYINTNRSATPTPIIVVPQQGLDIDQYVPIGDGLLTLLGLGSAYLLHKQKQNKKKPQKKHHKQ